METLNDNQFLFLLSSKKLISFFSNLKEKPFRVQQLLEWIILKNIDDFDSMINIPKSLRNQLSRSFVIKWPFIKSAVSSSDSTKKYIIELNDNTFIETVAIPDSKKDSGRLTLCVSSQVGCAMQCSFCATGKQGFTRNLRFLEILSQIILVQNDLNTRISNIVFMGQGEPFLNYEELMFALECINNNKLLNIGARKLTVSTCGIIPGIEKFSNVNKQYGLAVSLHSAIQETRDSLMPKVNNYNLESLKDCIISYINKTNRRISFEYILIKDINDDQKHLNALIDYCKSLLCHVNIIMLNKVNKSPYKPVSKDKLNNWIKSLKNNGIETTLRNSRGTDISAACGQLIYSYKQ